jgi:hypothetical protein
MNNEPKLKLSQAVIVISLFLMMPLIMVHLMVEPGTPFFKITHSLLGANMIFFLGAITAINACNDDDTYDE